MFTDSLESALKRRLNNLLRRRTILLQVGEASLVHEASLGQTQARHRVAAGVNKAVKYALLSEDRQQDGEENRVDREDHHRLTSRRQGYENTGR